jgi:hypothetical protein
LDEERPYNLSNRVYEEHHNEESLRRELYAALAFDEYNIHVKYNPNLDKLYLMLVYKNPARRMFKKNFEANWRILPNY